MPRIIIDYETDPLSTAPDDIVTILNRMLPHMVDNVVVHSPPSDREYLQTAIDGLYDISAWLETHEGVYDVFDDDPEKGQARYRAMQTALADAAQELEALA